MRRHPASTASWFAYLTGCALAGAAGTPIVLLGYSNSPGAVEGAFVWLGATTLIFGAFVRHGKSPGKPPMSRWVSLLMPLMAAMLRAGLIATESAAEPWEAFWYELMVGAAFSYTCPALLTLPLSYVLFWGMDWWDETTSRWAQSASPRSGRQAVWGIAAVWFLMATEAPRHLAAPRFDPKPTYSEDLLIGEGSYSPNDIAGMTGAQLPDDAYVEVSFSDHPGSMQRTIVTAHAILWPPVPGIKPLDRPRTPDAVAKRLQGDGSSFGHDDVIKIYQGKAGAYRYTLVRGSRDYLLIERL